MARSEPFTIQLPPDQIQWLKEVAERANLPPGEVISLQIVAQAYVAEVIGESPGPAFGVPDSARPPELPEASLEQESEDESASVMDMLSDARDRLDEWERKKQNASGRSDRTDALRQRLDDIRRRKKGGSEFGPMSPDSESTLIQQALNKIEEATRQSKKQRTNDDEDTPTSMFEIADEEGD